MPSQRVRALSTLSSRAKRGICLFLVLIALGGMHTRGQTARPKILGVASVSVVGTPPQDAIAFYEKALGLTWQSTTCASACITNYQINLRQHIGVTVEHGSRTEKESLSQASFFSVIFETSDAKAMREFLTNHGIQCSESFQYIAGRDSKVFYLQDPDEHRIGFVEWHGGPPTTSQTQVSNRLIHAGFIVQNRPAMEHFYKDILGFRPYWHGGGKDDGVDDWVSFQVPDGTDWIEFMLYDPTGKDKHFLGIMNHVALGVTDIQAAKAQLVKNGVTLTEEPKIGRDGKWQLNVYDPDETRIEFMEFTPKGKPCCSEFTAPHPKP